MNEKRKWNNKKSPPSICLKWILKNNNKNVEKEVFMAAVVVVESAQDAFYVYHTIASKQMKLTFKTVFCVYTANIQHLYLMR